MTVAHAQLSSHLPESCPFLSFQKHHPLTRNFFNKSCTLAHTGRWLSYRGTLKRCPNWRSIVGRSTERRSRNSSVASNRSQVKHRADKDALHERLGERAAQCAALQSKLADKESELQAAIHKLRTMSSMQEQHRTVAIKQAIATVSAELLAEHQAGAVSRGI
jgi:hypothetical protein